MIDERPDSEQSRARGQAIEKDRPRGKLKIFFGSAPGVGKTYAMLEAARKIAKEGVDVVVGYVEPHVRPETQALVLGLDVLSRLEVNHRGNKLLEFNLDAALERRPQLILVDELAHTNAPGLTYAKRWQDVERLLDAGLDVYTSLNVQHLESLNDIVAQITGVVVRETIPDSIFESADEVELVDISPDDLLERLREGRVYLPQAVDRALASFFTKGNLLALRELALQCTANRVGEQMDDYREAHAVRRTWPARDRLLVCIGVSPFAPRLVRATRRIATYLRAPWVAVNVETASSKRYSNDDRARLAQTLQLAEQLGGETAILNGDRLADELLQYARDRNVTRIVIGKPMQPRWREVLRGSLVYELARKCGDIDVYIISGDEQSENIPATKVRAAPRKHLAYAWAFIVVLLCTGIAALLTRYLAPTNLAMIYLLGVVGVALRFGRGPSILAAVLGVVGFDFVLIPPRWSLAVSNPEYVLTFAVMLLTGVVISTLVARVQFQVESGRRRERRTATLYAISRELAGTQSPEQIARIALRHSKDASDAPAVVLLPDAQGQLVVQGAESAEFDSGTHDDAVARWVFEHGQTAGHGTGTLPGAKGLYWPLNASRGTVGVLGILAFSASRPLDVEQIHLLEALAGLTALALERARLGTETEQIRLEVQTEQLRSALLSAVSHDLRTPLSVITGASSTLLDQDQSLEPAIRRELTASILEESQRLNRLVANLLDMTRLQAGALQVRKEWNVVEDVVGTALARLRLQTRDRPVTTHLADGLPLVPLDDLLIQQVLVNLLENAVRYTPPGTAIDVAARMDAASLVVEVADRGPGLPAGDPQRLFDKFHRGPTEINSVGAGLGLAICRGIVELHGGQIEADNRVGGGAVFRFWLPVEGQPPEQTIPEPEESVADATANQS